MGRWGYINNNNNNNNNNNSARVGPPVAYMDGFAVSKKDFSRFSSSIVFGYYYEANEVLIKLVGLLVLENEFSHSAILTSYYLDIQCIYTIKVCLHMRYFTRFFCATVTSTMIPN